MDLRVCAAVLGLAAAVLLPAPESRAQSFDLTWHSVDGGGLTHSVAGQYVLGASIGQPEAGTLTAAPVVVVGGFWASGKTECGDGAVTGGEQCDDGNVANGDCCSSVCLYEAAGTACAEDADPCTATTCDGAGACIPTDAEGVACNDGNPCTQGDACAGGSCTGVPIACGTPDQCHQPGICNVATGTCAYSARADGTPCSDGNACTQTDTCRGGACRGGDPVPCPVTDVCAGAGACDPASGTCTASPKPDGAPCDDGVVCTDGDRCVSGGCIGDPVQCPPGQRCGPAGACVADEPSCSTASPGQICDDGNGCTEKDECIAGACLGRPLACDDGNPCTDDGCDPAAGCVSAPNVSTAACDDRDECTVKDACASGACTGRRQCAVDVSVEPSTTGKRALVVTCEALDDGNPGATGSCKARAFVAAADTPSTSGRAALDAADLVGRPVTKRARKKFTRRRSAVTLTLRLTRRGRDLLESTGSIRIEVRVRVKRGTADTAVRRLVTLLQE